MRAGNIDPMQGTPKALIIESAGHEFIHALGMSHAPSGVLSLANYDPGRMLSGKDVWLISQRYTR